MGTDDLLKIAPAIAVLAGLGTYVVWQNKRSLAMAAKIRTHLQAEQSIALPDLVEKLGLKDGFLNRGRVISTLNPMVASGEVIQEEPEGTTMTNRIVMLRFRLATTQASIAP